MKILTVFYSRTGRTKKIGEQIAAELSCDVEEIFDTQKRKGPLGFMKSGYQATIGKLTSLKPFEKDPGEFDVVIIGTPIWNRHVSVPIRTYLSQNEDKFKKVAFFCTEGKVGGKRAFAEMEKISGKEPIAVLEIKREELKNDEYSQKLKEFIELVEEG